MRSLEKNRLKLNEDRFKIVDYVFFCFIYPKVSRIRERWSPRGRDRRGKTGTCAKNTAGPGRRSKEKCTTF